MKQIEVTTTAAPIDDRDEDDPEFEVDEQLSSTIGFSEPDPAAEPEPEPEPEVLP